MYRPEITIRNFQYPEDYQEVYALWLDAGDGIQLRRSDEPDEIEKKIARDPNLFLIAQAGDEVIGTVLGGYDGRRGMMYHLAVSTPYRRQGIAEMLVTELERRLQAKGCTRYYLLVTEDNNEAIRFYEKHGWEEMDALSIYAKDLV